MSGIRLSRAIAHDGAAATVRLVHLGLGNFFRAHQAWYTDRLSDAENWGYAAYAGRSRGLAAALTAQDGLSTLVARAADGDRFEMIGSITRAHAATEHEAWLGDLASPEVVAVTLTITEAGYLQRSTGGLDLDRSDVQADLAALRLDPAAPVHTAPARLVAGLAARRRVDNAPIALVPCDNLPGNGSIAARMVRDFAEALEPGLANWIDDQVAFVSTMVDRITPATTPADIAEVASELGLDDACPVVTEPFSEWVLAGAFPAGRPRWEEVGATFTDDVTTAEHRKLWLLNGAHSLLAYAAPLRGHTSVADAIVDETCLGWVHEWWDVASRHLDQPTDELDTYRSALLERFANPRLTHRLDQIALDGDQKLPVRILPVLKAERAAGRLPAGATRVLAAWACQSDEDLRKVLAALDPALADDPDVVAAVIDQREELLGRHGS